MTQDNRVKKSEDWYRQAESDLRKAKVLIDNKEFDGAVFYSHQAAEKAFKALWIIKNNEIPVGHSLIFLAQGVKYPVSQLSGIRDLNPEYLVTRYPDMADGVPSDLYDEDIASRHYATAKGVLEWVRLNLKK